VCLSVAKKRNEIQVQIKMRDVKLPASF